MTHHSAACICLCKGLHSHCLNSDWPKGGCVFLGKIAQPQVPTLPTALLVSFVIATLSDKLTTSEWVSEFDFTVGGKRSVFSLHCPLRALLVLTLSLFSVHLSLYFLLLLLLSSTASISLGWAPAPSVSQQSKHRRLTLPLLSCFSLISCCFSLCFDSS